MQLQQKTVQTGAYIAAMESKCSIYSTQRYVLVYIDWSIVLESYTVHVTVR